MSSANRRIRATLQIVVAIAFSGATGCASMISSLADPALERQFPKASVEPPPAAKYETPIPHQYYAYGPTNLRAQRREFERTASFVDFIDGLRWAVADLGSLSHHSVTITSIADKFCEGNSAIVTGMGWWGASNLQPMGLHDAVVRSQCRNAFRDHFLR